MSYSTHTSLLLLKEILYICILQKTFILETYFHDFKKEKRVLQQSERRCQADVLCFSKSNIVDSEQQQQQERGKRKIHQQVVQE